MCFECTGKDNPNMDIIMDAKDGWSNYNSENLQEVLLEMPDESNVPSTDIETTTTTFANHVYNTDSNCTYIKTHNDGEGEKNLTSRIILFINSCMNQDFSHGLQGASENSLILAYSLLSDGQKTYLAPQSQLITSEMLLAAVNVEQFPNTLQFFGQDKCSGCVDFLGSTPGVIKRLICPSFVLFADTLLEKKFHMVHPELMYQQLVQVDSSFSNIVKDMHFVELPENDTWMLNKPFKQVVAICAAFGELVHIRKVKDVETNDEWQSFSKEPKYTVELEDGDESSVDIETFITCDGDDYCMYNLMTLVQNYKVSKAELK